MKIVPRTYLYRKFLDPAEVTLDIDGKTDPCSNNRDINFIFKGVTVNGKVSKLTCMVLYIAIQQHLFA